jgi:predicted outer membrane protein
MVKLRVLVLAAMMGLMACDRNGEPEETAVDATLETPEQTQELLAPLRSFGLLAVDYAQTGMQRAVRPDVRQYGQTVAADHRALIAVLDSVAREHRATLAETPATRDLTNTVQMAHMGLENLTETAFDLAFIRAEVESHRQMLDRIDHEMIPAATSPGMQQLLTDTRAMVYAHLMRARQLLGDLLGQPVDPPPPGTTPERVPRTPPQVDTPTAPPTMPPDTTDVHHVVLNFPIPVAQHVPAGDR